MDLAALLPILIQASVVLNVLAIGLHSSLAEATSLFRAPGRLARAMAAMLLVIPVFTVLLVRAFDLHPAVKVALVALSLAPVPPVWPRKSFRAGGEETYTIGLYFAATLGAMIVAPLALDLVSRLFGLPVRPAAAVARATLLTVLLPLFLGIGLRRIAPGFAKEMASPLMTVAVLMLAVGALPLLVAVWPLVRLLVGDGTLLAMGGFVVVALAAGHLLGGPSRESRTTLALACASRHPGIALIIAQLAVPSERLALPAIVLFLLVSAAGTATYLGLARRRAQQPRGAAA